MNLDMKRFTAYCNVKETVPGSQLSYQASDVMWSGGQSIPEQEGEGGGEGERERERLFHNVLKGARQRQYLEKQK